MLSKAIIHMLVSACAFAVLNVLVKSLVHFDVFQIVFFRALGTLLITTPILVLKKIPVLGNQKLLLVSRGVVGVISMVLFFTSLNYLATGTAVSIRYTSPVFASIFALFLLKEKIKSIQWLFFLIAFAGVLLIKGIDFTNNLGFYFAISSAFFAGWVYFFIRKIGSKDHPVVVVNYFMIISIVIGGVLSISNWIQPDFIEWIQLLSLGFVGYIAQLYMTKGLQGGALNQVAPLKYIEVIITMFIGCIWLQETYNFISVLGILLIVTGLTCNLVFSKRN